MSSKNPPKGTPRTSPKAGGNWQPNYGSSSQPQQPPKAERARQQSLTRWQQQRQAQENFMRGTQQKQQKPTRLPRNSAALPPNWKPIELPKAPPPPPPPTNTAPPPPPPPSTPTSQIPKTPRGAGTAAGATAGGGAAMAAAKAAAAAAGAYIGWELSKLIDRARGRSPDVVSQQQEQESLRRAREQQRRNIDAHTDNTAKNKIVENEYPFRGGQSPVSYRIEYFYRNFGKNSSTWGQFQNEGFSTLTKTGPIVGFRFVQEGIYSLPNQGSFPHFRVEIVSQGGNLAERISDAYTPGIGEIRRITRVWRVDGQPDTGGDLAPTQSEVRGNASPFFFEGAPAGFGAAAAPTPAPTNTRTPAPVAPPSPAASKGDDRFYVPSPFGIGASEPEPEPEQQPDTQTGGSRSRFQKTTTYAPGSDEGAQSEPTGGPGGNSWMGTPPPALVPPTAPPGVPQPDIKNPNQNQPPPVEDNVQTTPPPTSCELNNACTLGPIQQVQRRQEDIWNKVNAGISGADLAQNTVLLRQILDRLGPQLTGGLSGFLTKAWQSTRMDKAINLVNLLLNAHNAAMLSRNLAETLGDAASAVLQFFQIKDHEQNAIDVNEVIGRAITDAIKGILGEEVYTGISKRWNLYNRIVTAGMGVVGAIQNMVNAAMDGINTIASWLAKMGNRAQEQGIVEDNSWQWMDENPNFKNRFGRLLENIDNLEEAADSVYMLVSSGIELQEGFTEAARATTEVTQALTEASRLKGESEAAEKLKNVSPTPAPADLLKHEPEEQ